MPNFEHIPGDQACTICGVQMYGITSRHLRRRCEDCGGNTTPYNARNPNPQSWLGLQLQKRAQHATPPSAA